MQVELDPGDILSVLFDGTDGKIEIYFDSDTHPMSLTVTSDLPDTTGREGIIYQEVFEPNLEGAIENWGIDNYDDISWNPAKLHAKILESDESDSMVGLLITAAEDTNFTVVQSEALRVWLLNYASHHNDMQLCCSAIRTGASMLLPGDVDMIIPLLDPVHSIEKRLVAMKMIGRIFEAQPPISLDQHLHIAGYMCDIANTIINPYIIIADDTNGPQMQCAVTGCLAVYALVAMGSTAAIQQVKKVKEINIPWFTSRLHHKINELPDKWPGPGSPRMNGLVRNTTELLTGA
jgi:hypothetical protein